MNDLLRDILHVVGKVGLVMGTVAGAFLLMASGGSFTPVGIVILIVLIAYGSSAGVGRDGGNPFS